MRLPQDLARLPVEVGARHLALAQLKHAGKVYDRFVDATRDEDPEALHDFRVALRRLRSCLRAYKPELRSTVSDGSYRRVRRFARATRESRDLEVHLAWVRTQLVDLPERLRTGVETFADELAACLHSADDEMHAVLDAEFDRGRRRLERQLQRLCLKGRLDDSRRARTTAAVTGALVLERGGALEARLSAIRGPADHDTIHAARIAAKQLRYLLEPFEDEVDGAPELLERLKDLQNVFGDLHDAHVFGEELERALEEVDAPDPRSATAAALLQGTDATTGDPRPGLLTLHRRLDERGREAYAAAETRWLGGHAAAFFERVARVAANLASLAGDDRELERKYLLRALPQFGTRPEVEEIEQGYLPGLRVVERLRRVRADGAERYLRTVKSGTGVNRIELEEPIEAEMFERLWPLTEGRRVRKRRHRVRDGQHDWEVDEYLDRELVVAEVELAAEDEEVRPPLWLQPVLLREITDEPCFSNRELAR